MSRNIHCRCLCHGTDGNAIGDQYFSCKNCYAAEHMGNLPRQSHEVSPRSKSSKPRKQPRAPKPAAVLEAVVKEGAKLVMENIALAAEMAKRETKQ